MGYGHRLTPSEVRLVEGARQRNVDLDRMSEVEIAARLVLPTDAVASTINVLRLPEELPPDMRWAGRLDGKVDGLPLPSRIEALIPTVISSDTLPIAGL